jgi:hypothetical protein
VFFTGVQRELFGPKTDASRFPVFIRYYSVVRVKEYEMDWTCGTHGGKKTFTQFW